MHERELERRLREAADGVAVAPDLAAVERGAARVRGRRRWATGVAAAMLVAGAGGAGFGLGWAAGDGGDAVNSSGDPVDPPAPAATSTVTSTAPETQTVTDTAVDTVAPTDSSTDASAATLAPEPGTAAPAATIVPGTGDAVDSDVSVGGDVGPYGPNPYTLIYTRTLADGTRIRALTGGAEWYGMGEWGVAGWEPAAWCYPTGELRVTLDAADLVDVTSFGDYGAANPITGVSAQRGEAGRIDGRPLRVLAVQTTEAATSVAVRWDDGATDTAEVQSTRGVLVVAGDSTWTETYELDVTTPEGTTTFTSGELDAYVQGAAYREACNPPAPALPAAGEQPPDPDAAWAGVQAAIDTLWNGDLTVDARLAVLDDATGVADALALLQTGTYADTAATAVFTIDEHVFTTPTEAWFRYSIDTDITDFSERYGIATLVDGQWRLPRAMFCADLSLAGATCQPAEPAIYPPSWYERNGQAYYSGCDPDGTDCWNCYVYGDGSEECYDAGGNLTDGAAIPAPTG